MPFSLRHKLFVLFLIHCFVLPGLATPRTKSRSAAPKVAKIVFEPANPVVQPGRSTTVKATALDQKNNPVPNAKIAWTVPQSADGLISISKPLGSDGNAIIVIGLTPAAGPAPATDVKVSATSRGVSADLVLHYLTEPAEITFAHDSIELHPGAKGTIVAKVQDAAGNDIHGLKVSWKLADKKFEDLVFLGPPTNNATTNSIDVVWLRKQDQKNTDIPLIATVGAASGVATINYKAKDEGNGNELIFLEGNKPTNHVTVSPTENSEVKVNVKRKDGTISPDAQIECDLDAGDRDFVSLNTKSKGKISLRGLGGNLETVKQTILLPCRAEGASAVLAVQYDAGSIDVQWGVLSSGIAGDNYGRTMRNDYYCINLKITNRSGADLTIASLQFVNAHEDKKISITTANYKTAHGSIARRKLTHPRSMTLAIVEGVGTLMTGFNPFFHNAVHGKNYSQFIDVLSNPLKSGIEKAWQDPYPGELAQFEADVLREDKVLAKGGYLETTVFVPKRWVSFTDKETKDRNDPIAVKEKLGILEVTGYQFKRLGERTYVIK